jgi:L-threonylcarbamoyladenylate synthase
MLKEIEAALKVLREGNLILYPTDTIWGIGCDATNPVAVKKVYQLKQREDSKSMLVLVNSEEMLGDYIRELPPLASDLILLSEKPLTIIYPGAIRLAPNLIGPDGSIGIRICKTSFCRELIQRFQKPIVSTSANISGQMHPGTFKEIEEDVMNGVDYIIDPGLDKNHPKEPSSIIKLGLHNEIEIIRE